MPGPNDPTAPPGDSVEQATQFAALARDAQPLSAPVVRQLEQCLAVPVVDARVYVAALAALVRGADPSRARTAWTNAATHPVAAIRRRTAELTPQIDAPLPAPIVTLLADSDDLVAEAACWGAGEVEWNASDQAEVVAALVRAGVHSDPLVREAAVAALGALGDPTGLDTILRACADQPTVRRRAVLALAPFDGPRVEDALRVALDDSDWQTRQAAEDLRS